MTRQDPGHSSRACSKSGSRPKRRVSPHSTDLLVANAVSSPRPLTFDIDVGRGPVWSKAVGDGLRSSGQETACLSCFFAALRCHGWATHWTQCSTAPARQAMASGRYGRALFWYGVNDCAFPPSRTRHAVEPRRGRRPLSTLVVRVAALVGHGQIKTVGDTSSARYPRRVSIAALGRSRNIIWCGRLVGPRRL